MWSSEACFSFFLINLFIFGCVGSSLLHAGLLQLRGAGATLRCGARASHCGGFSCCSRRKGFSNCGTRAQQLWLLGSRVQAQQLWRMGLVASRHVGSSRTRARTRVPCIGRRIPNHCATREVLKLAFLDLLRMCDLSTLEVGLFH